MSDVNMQGAEDGREYGRLLKSSLITGAAQVAVMALSFVRIKIAAVFIGAGGVGAIGLYNQALSIISTAVGLGLNSSAIREIAAESGAGNRDGVVRLVKSLRVMVFVTGAVGVIICLAIAPQISVWTFGDEAYATSFRVLAITIFLAELSNAQVALLRGLGRVRELAVQSVFTAAVSTVIVSIFYTVYGSRGIVPGMLALSVITLVGTWWFARKEEIKIEPVDLKIVVRDAKSLTRMGLAFVWSALISALVVYGIGIIVRQKAGIDGNGYYLSAWGVSGMFIGIILSSMGQDFYPRLTALMQDRQRACSLISKQMEIGLAMSLPAVVAMTGFAELIIRVLYTKDFMQAKVAILWFTAGSYLKITSWPLGYVLMAKGDALRFALTETAFALLWLVLSYFGAYYLGLNGAAFAFFLSYLIYCVAMRAVVGALIGFRFGVKNILLLVVGLLAMGVSVIAGAWIAALLVLLCAGYSLYWLSVTQSQLPLRKLLVSVVRRASALCDSIKR